MKHLRSIMHEDDVATYFPLESRLRACVNYIRTTYVTKTASNTVKVAKDLKIIENMATIVLNGKKCAFLQYDNENTKKNRILIYFTQDGGKILQFVSNLGFDGTFKFAPKIFYQIFTLIAIYKNQALPCVFFFIRK